MSTDNNSGFTPSENVISKVHTNVHAETKPEKPVFGVKSHTEKRPKVRHLSLLGKSWVYQRRAPRRLTKDQVAFIFRKRIGVLSVPKARQVVASLDRLVDALVFVGFEGVKQMMDLGSIAAGLDEATLAFMLSKMDEAFHNSVDKLLDEGFSNPERESEVIVGSLAKFRADLDQFSQSAASHHPEAKAFKQTLRTKGQKALGDYDRSLNNAELNLRGTHGRSFEELSEALNKTTSGGAVIDAGMAAFMEAIFGSEQFDAFIAQRKVQAAVSEALFLRAQPLGIMQPQLKWTLPAMGGAAVAFAGQETSSIALDQMTAAQVKMPEQSFAKFLNDDNQMAASLQTAKGLTDTTAFSPALPKFLGRPDLKFAPRPASHVKLFSIALAEYVAKREEERGLPVGATLSAHERARTPELKGQVFPTALTRDIGTLRTRAAMFIELVGDYPLDTYTKSDIEFFVHCLRFFPPKISDKTIADSGGLRKFLETQIDFDDGGPIGQTLALATVKEGFLAGLRPIFRRNPLEDRMIDPIALIPNDFNRHFGKSEARELFGDAALRNIVKEGIARRSLAFTLLPVLGVITSRRLSALTGLKGSDVELVYEAYDDTENAVFAAKIHDWVDENGARVEPALKTEVSRAHFVMHDLLQQIGFVKWAQTLGDAHIFQSFQSAADHESQASKIMGNYLGMMGAKKNQVFHSLRHQGIQLFRGQMGDENAVRHQAGHAQIDEHSKYGSSILPEPTARKLATITLPRWLVDLKEDLSRVDFNEFRLNDIRGATRLGKNAALRTAKRSIS